MINFIHKDTVIGIKKLTPSDLGFADNGITHIGLFKNTFNSLNINKSQLIPSTLIYNENSYDLLSIIDPITRANGNKDAPKIRKGQYDYEFIFNGVKMSSITKKVREIAEKDRSVNRYFLWFEIDTEELFYLLFDENSSDFNIITGIIGLIANRKIKIGKDKAAFKQLITFLNIKIENVDFEYYNELEIASQTGSTPINTKKQIPRPKDLERANKIFKAIGEEGEKLLFQYLESEKRQSNIREFKWLNQSREMYEPYDFEIIQNNGETIFSDAKATNKNFEDRPIYLSINELSFINDHKENYQIHRLYSINGSPKMRICKNIHKISDVFMPNFLIFNKSLNTESLIAKGIKLEVPTNLDILNFEDEILLNVNV